MMEGFKWDHVRLGSRDMHVAFSVKEQMCSMLWLGVGMIIICSGSENVHFLKMCFHGDAVRSLFKCFIEASMWLQDTRVVSLLGELLGT